MAGVHVQGKDVCLAQMLVGFGGFSQALQLQAHTLHRSRGEQRVGAPAGLFFDMVLEQAVGQANVGSGQLAPAADVLHGIFAVMHHELEVENRDGFAGAAGAGGMTAHILHAFAKVRVDRLQEFQQGLATDNVCIAAVGEDASPLGFFSMVSSVFTRCRMVLSRSVRISWACSSSV